MNKKTRNSLLLGLASVIWGISFVIQQIGGQALGAYTFNALRMFIGAFAVYMSTLVFDRTGYSKKPVSSAERKRLWLVAFGCGFFLALATNLQQVALNFGGSTGKAGFLTAVYILLVPILGIFFHKKCGWNVWVSVVIAVVGLYFLCINGGFSLEVPDLLLLSCALTFSIQILIIDRFGASVDGLRLSAIQFLITGVLSLIPALIFEIIPYAGGFSAWLMQFASWKIWLTLLYMGLLSCGIGYTLQIIGQRGLHPAVASLIMSLESVFALLSGIVFLHQRMSARELIGCCLMFAAICLSQVSFGKRRSSHQSV